MMRTILTVVALLSLGACSSPRAQFPVQRYVPLNRTMVPLGELHLSNKQMGFAALEGEMKLEYVGQMKEGIEKDLDGASIYRVKNWQAFHKQNENNEAWCKEAPQFVAVNSETGAPAWSREIYLSLLVVDDWEKYTPDEHHACAGGTYVRSKD